MAFNVFIRGIYSTALTKIFKDAGYNIIFPSAAILQRFPDLKEFDGNYSKDIIINERYDKEGISITMKKEIWEEVKDNFPINHESFPNAIILNARFPLNSISKGIVIQSNKSKNFSLVRLIPERSNDSSNSELENNYVTTIGRINKYLRIGTEDIFQVVFEDVGKNYAYLNQGYTVSGDLCVIMPYNKRGFISKKIKNKEQRQKLNNVIEKVSIKDFGILLRTAAQFASELEILREIQKLRDKYIEIETLINQSKTTIGPIVSEYVSMNVLLSETSKRKMDQIRSTVVPTMEMHHSIKAGLYTNNSMQMKILNLTENILQETNIKGSNENINNLFSSFYHNNLFSPKQFMNINHNKLNGRNISLRPGIIKKIERDRSAANRLKIILRRNLSGHGIYDGLDIPIEDGDYAISIYVAGNMYYETIYYSHLNELKGRYFNINTPIFLSANAIHYYDLEIDVIEPLNRPRKIIDMDLFDKALSLKYISQSLYDSALELAKKIESGEIKSELDRLYPRGPQKKVEESKKEEVSSENKESEN